MLEAHISNYFRQKPQKYSSKNFVFILWNHYDALWTCAEKAWHIWYLILSLITCQHSSSVTQPSCFASFCSFVIFMRYSHFNIVSLYFLALRNLRSGVLCATSLYSLLVLRVPWHSICTSRSPMSTKPNFKVNPLSFSLVSTSKD